MSSTAISRSRRRSETAGPSTRVEFGVYCGAGAHDKCRLAAATCGCECHRGGQDMVMVDVLECPECEKEFSRAQALAMHRKHHHGIQPMGGRGAAVDAGHKSKTVAELVWEDPPRPGRPDTASIVRPLIRELRQQPGKWPRLMTYKSKSSASTQAGNLRRLNEFADIEFKGSKIEGGSALYAKCDPTRL